MQESHSNVETYFITTANNEKYKCIIPNATEQEQEYSEAYNGPNPMKLLQTIFNQDSCSYRVRIYRIYWLSFLKNCVVTNKISIVHIALYFISK